MKTSENNTILNIKKRADSFKNAFHGFKTMVGSEPNLKIHLAILIIVTAAGLALKISVFSWMAIILVSGMVLVSECFNTALEYLSDAVMPEYSPDIKKVKDIAAAGVLISAVLSVITGLLVFVPEIIKLLHFR